MPRKRASKTWRKSNRRTSKLVRVRKNLLQIQDNTELDERFQFAEIWKLKIVLYIKVVVETCRRHPRHRRAIIVSHIVLSILIASIFTNCGSIFRVCWGMFQACINVIAISSLLKVFSTNPQKGITKC